MYSLFSLKLCSCFRVRKKRKKPGTNMREVVESGSLAAFKIKKSVRFRQDDGVSEAVSPMANLQTETGGEVGEDTLALGHQPSITQVEPNRVLEEGIKCRSWLKCKDRPRGRMDLQCCVALGKWKRMKNKQTFHTWLFLGAELRPCASVWLAFRLLF